MPFERFTRLLKEVGELNGVPDLRCDGKGYCCFVPEDDIMIHMQLRTGFNSGSGASRLIMYNELITLDMNCLYYVCPFLLQWNMDDKITGRASLGVFDKTILMFMDVPCYSMDSPSLQNLIEEIICKTKELRCRMQQMVDDYSIDSGGIITNDVDLPCHAIRV